MYNIYFFYLAAIQVLVTVCCVLITYAYTKKVFREKFEELKEQYLKESQHFDSEASHEAEVHYIQYDKPAPLTADLNPVSLNTPTEPLSAQYINQPKP